MVNNPTHTYAATGVYTVKLDGFNHLGQVCDSAQEQVFVSKSGCYSSFSSTQNGLTVNLTNTSIGPSTQSNWNFGNGQFSNQANPTITYSTPGDYWITLEMTDTLGQTCGLDSQLFLLSTPCEASFTYTRHLDTLLFDNTSTGGFASQVWDFGDGNSSGAFSPKYVYQNTGAFEPCLTLFSEEGQTCATTCDSLQSITHVAPSPLPKPLLELQLSPNPVTLLGLVSFELEKPQYVRIEVLNPLGQSILVLREGRLVAGRQTAAIDAGLLSTGLYLVRVQTESQQAVQRLVIQH